jgi:hypothetical protein
MSGINANELTDRITVRLADMHQRRQRRRFFIAIVSLSGLLTTMLFTAAVIWILTD